MIRNLKLTIDVRTKAMSQSDFLEDAYSDYSKELHWEDGSISITVDDKTVRDIIMRDGPHKVQIDDNIRLYFKYNNERDIAFIIIYDDKNYTVHIVQSKEMFFSELFESYKNMRITENIMGFLENGLNNVYELDNDE